MKMLGASVAVAATLAATCISAMANGPIAPYKDALFAYSPHTASTMQGRMLDVPYDEMKDINGRDSVPERRAQGKYVQELSRGLESDATIATAKGDVTLRQVGKSADPAFLVLFVHGRGGDRRLGMNDWTFGGNFNRLKNLAVRSDGLYLTMDAGALEASDAARAGEVLKALSRQYPSAKHIVACGSMGGQVCWSLAQNPAFAASLDGMVLLGASSSPAKVAGAVKARGGKALPLLIAHGSNDRVYAMAGQVETVEKTLAQSPAYPIRFVGFDTGGHGTPIRMLDWRDTLNWLIAR
ncbi:alpha/beta hydrolase [Aureimonas fodinaquatilis]|uniref:Alpha/beta hydrolase n=1 Tax=Aureimonas fodinaquatilis TaxID=2565783 RepID=A0A5B0DZA6_9HYPH|nr:alpha/beta hydrolase [Aureimonas fodinaquatilis]KAA0970539.1 alpha/beta hydrolase [Aureimonas fodinaquatilis]